MAKSTDNLRDLVIYISSNGQAGMWSQSHVFTYRVVDSATGETVYSNEATPAKQQSGGPDLGSHAALLDFLPRLKTSIMERWAEEGKTDPESRGILSLLDETSQERTLTIITSDGDRTLKAYTVPPAELIASNFKWASGGHVANAAWIARVLADAEAMRLSVRARPHANPTEEQAWHEVRRAGKRRWTALNRPAA